MTTHEKLGPGTVPKPAAMENAGNGKGGGSIRARNQESILAAAEFVFAKEGYSGATIEKIAKVAELPRANVMYYFKDKKTLYLNVLYSMCLAWEVPANEFSKYSNPEEVLRRYIKAKIDFARERPYGSKVWVSEVLRGATMIDSYLREHLKGWLDSRSEVIQHWINLGLIAPIDPRTLLYSIWATTQHYADFSDQLKVLNDDRPFTDAQYDKITKDLTQLYLRGLGLVN